MESIIYSKIDYSALLKGQKKGLRRQLQIAEFTIDILHRKGLVNFSYDDLAKKCGITRGVIYSYFPRLEDLLLFSCGLIRYRFQTLVVSEVSKAKTPKEMLIAYATQSLRWTELLPKDATVWLLFFHYCTVSAEVASYNREWVDLGTQRIAAILLGGLKHKQFLFPEVQALNLARHIQILVTGGLLSHATESRTAEAWENEKKLLVERVLQIAGSQYETSF